MPEQRQQTNLRLPPPIYEMVRRIAYETSDSQSNVILKALLDHYCDEPEIDSIGGFVKQPRFNDGEAGSYVDRLRAWAKANKHSDHLVLWPQEYDLVEDSKVGRVVVVDQEGKEDPVTFWCLSQDSRNYTIELDWDTGPKDAP